VVPQCGQTRSAWLASGAASIQCSCAMGVRHAAEPLAIVMGSHGRRNLANLVMGSVATKVLATTQTPVLLVR